MTQAIGEAAGKIWSYLNQNGAASASAISRNSGLPRSVSDRAIGWLAREGKLVIEKENRAERIRLQQ